MRFLHPPAATPDEGLNADEASVLRCLESERPELAGPFLKALAGARRDVMLRLLESVLRENLGGISERLEGREGVASLSFHAVRLVLRIEAVHAFRRYEVGSARLAGEVGEREIEGVSTLIPLLKSISSAPDSSLEWDALERELENAAANLALSRAARRPEDERLRSLAKSLGAADSAELASYSSRLSHSSLAPEAELFFERMCVEGHNLHPSAKTKLGMEPRAVLQRSPELDGEASLRVVAVRRDLAPSASVGGESFDSVLFSVAFDARESARAELASFGLSLEDYALVPVHPWQFEEVLPSVYKEEIPRREILPLEDVSIPASATSSFRTVLLEGRDLAVKTSVSSQMTSTVRTISPNTALNAPEFTRLLDDVSRREPRLAETFIPVRELAGVYFDGDSREKRRSLSAVIREGQERFSRPGELPVCGLALYAESPVTGETVLSELVRAHGRSTGAPSVAEAARDFVLRYARVALPGFLTLMSVYGIGLEGHLQNCVPVFREGSPTRMLFRDWGGARVHESRLRESGVRAEFAPGSITLTEDPEEMRRKVFYTVFQNHLGEILLQASKSAGVPERELWRGIRRVCEEVFDALSTRPGLSERVSSDREALFARTVHHKALVHMRLQPGKGDLYTETINPLGDDQAS